MDKHYEYCTRLSYGVWCRAMRYYDAFRQTCTQGHKLETDNKLNLSVLPKKPIVVKVLLPFSKKLQEFSALMV